MGPGPRSRGRGGSRGSGRGGSRGGARGRGGRGRGRGRGRAGRFNSSRLDEQKDSDESESEAEAAVEEEAESEIEEEEEEVDEAAQKRREAYLALMKSFETRSAGPAAKRRKLDHDDEEDAHMDSGDEDVAEDDDDSDDDDDDDDDANEQASDEEAEPKDVDFAEDEDEDAEEEIEIGGVDDEPIDTTDPFESHFSAPDLKDVSLRLMAIKEEDWLTTKVAANGSRAIFTVPQTGTDTSSAFSPPAAIVSPQQLKLKKRLADLNTKPLRPTEQKVAPLLFNYYDTLFCERTPDNGDELRHMASLHAVNHVFKTRDRVLKNNEKLARIARKQEEAGKAMDADNFGNAADDDDDDGDAYRDQGYNRPKVLMLLPTRQSCARMVEAICRVCEPETQENRKRFEDGYVDKHATIPADRPADFRDLFEGNDDDMFRLGLKFTRKSIKFFSKFYNSDIILASPLGLRMAMGSDDTSASFLSDPKKKNKGKDKIDIDFLSSIELVLMDQADALLMQNWEHVEHIFTHLNLLPRETANSDYDISRLRSWYLDDQAKFYRQTVVFSAHHSPALAELFRRFCTNWAGKVRVQPAAYKGVVGRLGVGVGVSIRQTFSRFDAPTIDAEPDARFDYFVKAVVPSLIARTRGGTSAASHRVTGVLVFIPSYLDFVRVRNWFATADAVANVSFGAVSEYASVAEASRAISHFLTGRHRVLLYTERAHHFRRHIISGVRTVVLYGLPENPTFYTEITGGYLGRSQRNQLLEPGQGVVRAMFSPFDAFKLERIVGTQRVGRMIRERSDTFVFEEERGY